MWGLNWPAVRIVLSWWSPWTLRFVGLGAGAVLLFMVVAYRGQTWRIGRDQWWRLIISALLTIVGFSLGTAFAQLSGSTSRAAIVTYSMPVWTVLFAWFVLGERLDRARAASVLLGISGLMMLAMPLLTQGGALMSSLFALAAGISWAGGTVYMKRFPIRAPAMTNTAWQLTIGSLVGLAGGWLLPTPAPAAELAYGQTAFVIALGFHVILATAAAYLIWFDVVARLPAGVAALGTLAVPTIGVGGAMLLLGERPSPADLGGFVMIMVAAALALLVPHRPGQASRD